ncbi:MULTISPECIES: 50S ribosomal protein L10 [unclassified Tessaracoccus]|uniref:50S ribosomal protein L10 n=1 Tax=unclassified Tessaracoccus TaxID=2635419 RepID=UPI00096F9B22|nr:MULTISPECIES: 50S ribosomal protein L10 [unclassified Tessaracoccus]MBB1508708.1 50S ribosomal protein L10 [Tessaracoccus sp. MC1756]MCG6567235.1 50S ribosomal protein L10 [Tessaracoccus sp. ZS01]OMG57200.1 50S ribosomal protein L10 [Tessaracoccus sp. ZS01]
MARPDKAAKVSELAEAFSKSGAAVLTEYRGLTVAQLKQLRRSLGENATYAVAKNTLTAIAAKEAGIEGLDETLTGPTAIAFVTGDIAAATKGLRDFAKANPSLAIKGGVLEGKFLDAQAVLKLADLESREVLLAKMAGALQANLAKAAYMLAAPLSQGARVLGALRDAAQADPSLIGGAGSAPATEATDETPAAEAAPEAAEAAE